MLISPTMLIPPGTSQALIGQDKPDNRDFMRVLLGEVSRSLQRTSEVFSARQGRASFGNPLAGPLFGQVLAEKLTEHLVGRSLAPLPAKERSAPLPEKAPTPDNPPFDPFFAPLPENTTQLARQGEKMDEKAARFLPFLYHDRL